MHTSGILNKHFTLEINANSNLIASDSVSIQLVSNSLAVTSEAVPISA